MKLSQLRIGADGICSVGSAPNHRGSQLPTCPSLTKEREMQVEIEYCGM